MTYLIWSNQHGMWWRPLRRGYTSHLAEAGRYTADEAARIVDDATCGGELTHERVNQLTGETYQELDEVIVPAPDSPAGPETIYITMINDRHAEPEAYPFTTAECAITYAKRHAAEHAHDPGDIRERPIPGWLYHAWYSSEDDSVWVVEKPITRKKV